MSSARFLSTLSLRRATNFLCYTKCNETHFYPRSPCGERRRRPIPSRPGQGNFYPRSPCGERPGGRRAADRRDYFYPRSPCGERLKELQAKNAGYAISIHALLAESDDIPEHQRRAGRISIHALLAESDAPMAFIAAQRSRFLSTLSLRRATPHLPGICGGGDNFYPRSPCGERPHCIGFTQRGRISIHALLAESDIIP